MKTRMVGRQSRGPQKGEQKYEEMGILAERHRHERNEPGLTQRLNNRSTTERREKTRGERILKETIQESFLKQKSLTCQIESISEWWKLLHTETQAWEVTTLSRKRRPSVSHRGWNKNQDGSGILENNAEAWGEGSNAFKTLKENDFQHRIRHEPTEEHNKNTSIHSLMQSTEKAHLSQALSQEDHAEGWSLWKRGCKPGKRKMYGYEAIEHKRQENL